MKSKMRRLIIQLNEASKAYYGKGYEVISNHAYDTAYNELLVLEKETGIVLSNSPTQRVGYEVVSDLEKVEHDTKMLSLNKTKSVDDLKKFLGDKYGVLSYKLDGLTVVLTYEEGKLIKATTRGNGEIGEDVLHNVKVFSNVPLTIDKKERLVLRGEAVISYETFEKINADLPDEDKYKNPRNLCSGATRQLKSEICADRNVEWIAFDVIEGVDHPSKFMQLVELDILGFQTVKRYTTEDKSLVDTLEGMSQVATGGYEYPVDGLVLIYDDVDYGKSLGSTSHHPKHSMAFKWKDDIAITTLRNIELDIGKSGQLSYTAIFDPVEIEGTTVTRATLHNYDRIKELELGIGDDIGVIKANMIIPQVVENLTKSGEYNKALFCPICGSTLEHKGVHQFCVNYDCERQIVGRLVHWCSRDAMNIDGLSEETIKKIRDGRIPLNDVADFYYLYTYKDALSALNGFGKRKVDKLLDEIEKSKTRPLSNVLYGLSIPSVGRTASKKLAEWLGDTQEIINGNPMIGAARCIVGNSIGGNFFNYMTKEGGLLLLTNLRGMGLTMTQPEEEKSDSQSLEGLTFVVTGKVEKFANRKEVQAYIESNGGKVSGSVSKNTTYLLNNDVTSTTGKNKKAKELGVNIIGEAQLILLVTSAE